MSTSGVSFFENATNIVARNTTFNNVTYVSGMDGIRFLEDHAATGAMHDSEERYPAPVCHPGTRQVILVRIKDWYGFVTRPDKPILWVHAPAGYGKTALAGSISKMLEDVSGLDFSPLGATFYFWRTSPERNSPARFVITIACQLAASIPELAPHIDNAVKRNRMILRKSLETQLMKLIVEPFRALGELDDMPSRLVIIDGLDECINADEQSRAGKQYAEDQEMAQIRILDIILSLQSHGLPLLFLILSRPEAWIKQHIKSCDFDDLVEELDLYAIGDHLDDTEKYIRGELSRVAARLKADGALEGEADEWPGEDTVQTFVERTNGHMLYASIVIRHIDNPYGDPRQLLENIFVDTVDADLDLAHSSPLSPLYELYRQIMQSCPESNRSLMIEVLEDISSCIDLFSQSVDFRRALSILDRLAGRALGKGFRALRPLHGLLRITHPEQGNLDTSLPLPYIHSSFGEFLNDTRLSLKFTVDQHKGFRRILGGCLDCMSMVTSEGSKVEADDVVFSTVAWPTLFSMVYSSSFNTQSYLNIMEKLLSIDFQVCSKMGLGQQLKICSGVPSLELSYAFHRDHKSVLVTTHNASILFDNEPRIQQAVTHVASSYEAGLVFLLSQPLNFWPSRNFIRFLLIYLEDQPTDPSQTRTDCESNLIIQALKKVRQERPEDYATFAGSYIHDINRQLSEFNINSFM